MNNEPLFFKTLLLKGEAGGTIDRIEKTDTVGLTDIYTIYINDGSTQEIEVTNGSSIASIEYTSSSGNVDTYTVTLTDGSTTTFNVTNGEDYTVPTDGVIYYDGSDIPDGYEEAPAPSGSGAYATIDDNNASVSTTYSSAKIEQLISGVVGGVDYSTTEQYTGLKWIDGKKIYKRTFDFGINDLINGGISTTRIDGTFDIDSYLPTAETVWLGANDSFIIGNPSIISQPINYASDNTYTRSNIQREARNQHLIIYYENTYSASTFYDSRTLLHFIFTVYYTKTTDTV